MSVDTARAAWRMTTPGSQAARAAYSLYVATLLAERRPA